MRYLSLFSGIEAASVAWKPLGWECVGVSEIEKFPCKVLAHRYPDVPNLGDITKITEADIAALGQIDLVVFGAPCQDLSVAGKRKGMLDADGNITRSGLFFTAINIVHWARRHCGCRFALYENVPGLFSSNKGADFASVVEYMAGLDDITAPKNGWGNEGCAVGDEGMVEWAVLDAQFVRTPEYPTAVPQRRRRVFALADFGDWTSRPPILLERESLRGNTPTRRKAECEVASTLRTRAPGSGGQGTDFEQVVANTIPSHTGISAPDFTNYIAEEFEIRRLTPLECERLQGFPDNFTNIAGSSDSTRYKVLGNSMACNVMNYIGERVQMAVDYK